MVSPDWRTEFEAVEGRAHELVEALETLQREASEYRDLNRTIEGGSKSLVKVADAFEGFLPRVDKVMQGMDALGTELRQDVDAIGRRLDNLKSFLMGLLGLSVILLIGLGALLFRG